MTGNNAKLPGRDKPSGVLGVMEEPTGEQGPEVWIGEGMETLGRGEKC